MKNIVFIIGFLFVSCSKNAQVYTPVGGMSNEEITLLVPSVLAYGTYGDGDQIPYDMPLIIKLKLTK